MEKEVWKDVPGYEGLYQVSNLGNVRSLDRVALTKNGHENTYRSKLMTKSFGNCANYYVSLSKLGCQTGLPVDVLVATAFIRPGMEGEFVGHLDGDDANDHADNLVWVSADEYLEMSKRFLAIADKAAGDEEWRDIPGCDGFYQASSLGRIRSVTRIVNTPKGPVKRKGKVLSLNNHYRGYVEATLNYRGKSLRRKVHRLVAEAFIPNPDGLPEVDHIDMNRANNRVENLQWITHRDNCHRSIQAGTYSDNFSNIPRFDRESKSKWATGRPVMRDDGVVYASIAEAARANGCKDRCSIKNALVGRTKTCNGHSFSYI